MGGWWLDYRELSRQRSERQQKQIIDGNYHNNNSNTHNNIIPNKNNNNDNNCNCNMDECSLIVACRDSFVACSAQTKLMWHDQQGGQIGIAASISESK